MLPEPSMSAVAAEASANAAATTMPGGAVVVEAGQSAPPVEPSAPSANPTPSLTATPTTAPETATASPTAAQTAAPLADFVAPTVIGVNAVGCQVIGAGSAFKHTYTVSLAGGRGWYYRDQRAPEATATVTELSPSRSITRDVISVSVGDNPGQSTGKLLNVKFPAPFVSECK